MPAEGIAFGLGRAFFADSADARTLRLSCITVPAATLERAVAALGQLIDRGTPASGEESR